MSEEQQLNENSLEVSVVMPCLNEEDSVEICINKCFQAFEKNNIKGEVVVVDNGSTDRSKEIIINSKARLIEEKVKGYGSAYLRGFSEARGKYIIMGDSDDTYDFLIINDFIKPLREGYDFVIGKRILNKMKNGSGAMPWLHRYIGNPVLSGILRLFFGINISDAHCGMRSLTKEAYKKMNLKSLGMEFASEMVIRAKKTNLKFKEIPIEYRLRIGESKLRTFRDGWRHLRFMLIYSPTHLFFYPGLLLFALGLLIVVFLIKGPIFIYGFPIDFHVMFFGSMLMVIGYQIINLGFFAKIYSHSENFEEESNDKIIVFILRKIKLEQMILVGTIAIVAGMIIFGDVVIDWKKWMETGRGTFNGVRKMIPAFTLIILGFQNIFFGFYYSILKIEKK